MDDLTPAERRAGISLIIGVLLVALGITVKFGFGAGLIALGIVLTIYGGIIAAGYIARRVD